MQKYNLIIVYNQEKTKVLMCLRKKNPYKGLYNFVGGKIENNESSISAAYRELFEETGINKDVITLIHLMDAKYYLLDYSLDIYYGVLKSNVHLIEELNKLFWIELSSNFSDVNLFAGDGNIDHIIRIANKFVLNE